jgi:hypothetical protein
VSYVIEEGIPLPQTSKGGNYVGPKTEVTRVIEELEPMQSVLLTEHKDYKAADAYAGRHRLKRYAIRKVAGEGWRIWRIE